MTAQKPGDVLGVPEEQRQATLSRIPMGRFGRPQDIANAVPVLRLAAVRLRHGPDDQRLGRNADSVTIRSEPSRTRSFLIRPRPGESSMPKKPAESRSRSRCMSSAATSAQVACASPSLPAALTPLSSRRLIEGALDVLRRTGGTAETSPSCAARRSRSRLWPGAARTAVASTPSSAWAPSSAARRRTLTTSPGSRQGIAQTAMNSQVPVIFGVLTTDTIEQAVEQAGTKAGNKGADAALAALEIVSLYGKLAAVSGSSRSRARAHGSRRRGRGSPCDPLPSRAPARANQRDGLVLFFQHLFGGDQEVESDATGSDAEETLCSASAEAGATVPGCWSCAASSRSWCTAPTTIVIGWTRCSAAARATGACRACPGSIAACCAWLAESWSLPSIRRRASSPSFASGHRAGATLQRPSRRAL